jgi:hypothetical protein
MILKGEKKEEYREIKPYYTKRFQNFGLLGKDEKTTFLTATIGLRNGYSAKDPMLRVRVDLRKRCGKEEWGAEKDVEYYCLRIIEIYDLSVNGEVVWKH